MNKTHWNSVKADGSVPDEILREMLDKAYKIVLNSLSRKKQREILGMTGQNESISCCGADCGACYCYSKMCKGCSALCGKVFHAPAGKACPVYDCCRIQNGFHSCGECEKLPCDLIMGTRDPRLSEEEFMKTIDERIKRLRG